MAIEVSESELLEVDDSPSFINFKLNDFDGPLDVLLGLIKNKKMDILNLNIAALTDQYLKYISENIDTLEIDTASDYLVMASYLIELKARYLIPVEVDGANGYEGDYERDRFIQRLLEYKKYKEAIPLFREKQAERMKLMSKLKEDFDIYIPETIPEAPLPEHANVEHLRLAMMNLMNKYVETTFVQRKVVVKEINVGDIQDEFMEFLVKNNTFEKMSLTEYIESLDPLKLSPEYFCATFVALLVLVRYRKIKLLQEEQGDEIYIIKNNEKIEEDDVDDIRSAMLLNNEIALEHIKKPQQEDNEEDNIELKEDENNGSPKQ